MKKTLLRPMLATLGDSKDLELPGYLYEPKLDGYRVLCYVNEDIYLISRNGNDLSDKYPECTTFRNAIKAASCILDGELVVFDDEGIPSFELLQGGSTAATYVVFDILSKDGKSLIDLPLIERKKILKQTVKKSPPYLELIAYTMDGTHLWNNMIKHGIEGVIAKDPESLYVPHTRTTAWIKIKVMQTADCIIIGYTSKKRTLSSLALGLYDRKKKLHYVGKVGTGFSEKLLHELHKKLTALPTAKAPDGGPKGITWIKPQLVAEIQYLEATKSKRLRTPSFLHLRNDKKSSECRIDQIA